MSNTLEMGALGRFAAESESCYLQSDLSEEKLAYLASSRAILRPVQSESTGHVFYGGSLARLASVESGSIQILLGLHGVSIPAASHGESVVLIISHHGGVHRVVKSRSGVATGKFGIRKRALSQSVRKRRGGAPTRPESFVIHANRLDKQGRRNAAMDLIYDQIDELMRSGRFEQLDTILANVPVKQLTIDVLLGLLTASLPAKSKLPSRKVLFDEVESSLRERDELEDGLLTGLE